jgi:hypothetical protein
VDGEVLFQACGAPAGMFLFFQPDASVAGVDERVFSPLSSGLIQPEQWTREAAAELEVLESIPATSIWLDPLGAFPLRGAKLPR